MTRAVKIILGVVVLVIVVAIVLASRLSSSEDEVKTAKVERRNLEQTVLFTGRLRSQNRANIAFEYSGTAQEVLVDVGDVVEAGQTLVSLDSRGQQLEVARARADVLSAQDKARVAWEASKTQAERVKQESSSTLDKARQAVRDAKADMDQAREIWQQAVRESGDESSAVKTKYAVVLAAETAYHTAQQALIVAQATTEKNDIAANDAIVSARTAYISTTQSSSTSADLSSLEASAALANVRLAKSVAVAPFDGVVTSKNIERGELAQVGQTVISVETTDQLEIIADVTEADIAKLETGMDAVFSLDAYSQDDEWSGRIVSIAPAAKVLEGVPTYEVVIATSGTDARLKPGMTANVAIKTAERNGVLAIPRRAIIRSQDVVGVTVRGSDGHMALREITLGLSASDGFTEVLSGLSEGEEIVTSSQSSGS